MCGGTGETQRHKSEKEGLSPRVRGNPQPCQVAQARNGSIPACAGEPALHPGGYGGQRVYPRVCGGTMLSGP